MKKKEPLEKVLSRDLTGSGIQCFCNGCGRDTKHSLLLRRHKTETDQFEDGAKVFEFPIDIYNEVLECCGCQEVTLRREIIVNEPGESVEYFPPRTTRRHPMWFDRIPDNIRPLLVEVYDALHSGGLRLATMGTRAILDIILLKKVGDIGGFQAKLSEVEKEGLITSKQRRTLEAAFNFGSAVSHRGHAPSSEEVAQVLDIVESLVQADLLAVSADSLRKSTPSRLRLVSHNRSIREEDTGRNKA